MPTHIRAEPGDVARCVLLPGDPDRAQYIAERFLASPRRITSYRRMDGYTGTWGELPVTVQTTGMGGPSAAIVVEELAQLGARVFVRVGTCGTSHPAVQVGDLIVATAACACNGATPQLVGVAGYAPAADFELVVGAVSAARTAGQRVHAGLVATMDLFYDPDVQRLETLTRFGVLAFEMEASVVLTLGARPGCRGACLLTVSDHIPTQVRAAPEAILRGVDGMVEAALTAMRAVESPSGRGPS